MRRLRQWTTILKHVDIETGEEITKEEYNKNYYTIKKTKYVRQPIRTSSARIAEITKAGRRKPTQLTLRRATD